MCTNLGEIPSLVPNTDSLFFRASEVAMTVAGTPTYMAPEIQDRAKKGAQ